ncbi:MAG: IS200/IS605 family element transposase accessory protein TnpB [Cyanothece sp. SIO2G6]|nr:IS200/IS605 family element transposase accessory protein TnpB [Cyanothece sp. SIO2G6]
MKLRYNYRIYPTAQQQERLAQTFGCSRVVWNDALAMIKGLEEGVKWPSNADLQKLVITQAKQSEQRSWLSGVSNIPLQQSVRDLGSALSEFFKSLKGERQGARVGFPRFKKRHDTQSARFTRGGFSLHGEKLYLAKIGDLKVMWSRPLPSEPSSVTVLRNKVGQYHVSFVVEVDIPYLPAEYEAVGVDLGINTFATTSAGEFIESPNYNRLDRKIRRFQRQLARQVKGSKRWQRTKHRIAKLHLKIANLRNDFLHKLSTRLVKENQLISLEDLNVKGMVKNRSLSRAISLQGWGIFRTMCTAKCAMYGREFQVISRWEPTSQVCSSCGYRWGKLDLAVREVVCLNCGTKHDRDENAALNILRSGVEQSQDPKNGHGVSVRPSQKAVCDEVSTHLVVEQLSLFAS